MFKHNPKRITSRFGNKKSELSVVIIKDVEKTRTKMSFWRNNFDPARLVVGNVYSFSRVVVDKFPPEKPYYLQHVKNSVVKLITDQRILDKFLSIEIADGKLEGKN